MFTSKMVVHFTPEKVVQFGRNNQFIAKHSNTKPIIVSDVTLFR